MQHTETFNDELDRTREIAIEAHSKQKQDNVDLKKRLLQAKKIIESYDRRLKRMKNTRTSPILEEKDDGNNLDNSNEAATASAAIVGDGTIHSTETTPQKLANALLETKIAALEKQLEQTRIDAENETKAMVEIATSNMAQVHHEEVEDLQKQLNQAKQAHQLALDDPLLASTNLSEEKLSQKVEKAVLKERAIAEQKQLENKENFKTLMNDYKKKTEELNLQKINDLKQAAAVATAATVVLHEEKIKKERLQQEKVFEALEEKRNAEKQRAQQRELELEKENTIAMNQYKTKVEEEMKLERSERQKLKDQEAAMYVEKRKEEQMFHEKDKEEAIKEMEDMLNLLEIDHADQMKGMEDQKRVAIKEAEEKNERIQKERDTTMKKKKKKTISVVQQQEKVTF